MTNYARICVHGRLQLNLGRPLPLLVSVQNIVSRYLHYYSTAVCQCKLLNFRYVTRLMSNGKMQPLTKSN